jgi:hypothetical protein
MMNFPQRYVYSDRWFFPHWPAHFSHPGALIKRRVFTFCLCLSFIFAVGIPNIQAAVYSYDEPFSNGFSKPGGKNYLPG